MRTGALQLIGSVIVVSAGIALLWRNLPKSREQAAAGFIENPPAEALKSARRTSEMFSKCQSFSLDEIDSIVEHWIGIESGGDSVDDSLKRSLAVSVLEFLEHKSADSPDVYIDWIRSRGNTISSEPYTPEQERQLLSKYRPNTNAKEYSRYEYFRDRWEWDIREFHADGFPVRVTAASGCCIIYYHRITDKKTTNIIPSEYYSSSDQIELWNGSLTKAIPQLWVPAVSKAEIIERNGFVLHSNIKLGIQGRTGIWFSASIRAFYDPYSQMWHIDEYIMNNTFEVRGGLLF